MKIIEKVYKNGITSAVIDTKKFKKNYFSLTYTLPMTESNASNASALAATLERGCEKYPTVTLMNRHLCALYDASVGVYVSSCVNALLFRVVVNIIDGKYALEKDFDLFYESLEFVKEMLFSPLTDGAELNPAYVESEKKRLSDIIKADINNKDRYAVKRCSEIAYEGTPLAIGTRGSLDSVSAVTPRSAYEMLKYITEKCACYAVFSGDFTEDKERALDKFLSELSREREGKDLLSVDIGATLPSFDKTKEVIEPVSAKQGRMVLSYSYESDGKSDVAPMLFDEIFGASPVSRLFMNVRERLSLCYYCASGANIMLSRMLVRSGLDFEKRDEAMAEIKRQIGLLSEAKNISDEELMMAKKSRISTYAALKDSCSQYADWYVMRRIAGYETDVDAIISAIEAVSAEDVARIARSLKLEVSYFLNGTEGAQA